MAKWKKTIVKPNRILWTKGDERFGDFIHIDKVEDGYNVGARNKINLKTINGHFKLFKTKTQALKYARSYMRKH